MDNATVCTAQQVRHNQDWMRVVHNMHEKLLETGSRDSSTERAVQHVHIWYVSAPGAICMLQLL